MNCICGNAGCNGLCETSKGMRLVLLLKKAGTLQTFIGEEAPPDLKGTKYRYTGLALFAKDGDGRLCKLSENYRHKKVTSFTGNVLATLNSFKETGMTGIDDIIEKAKNVLNNDEVFYPIKVGNSVRYLEEGSTTPIDGKITKITIGLDDNGDMQYKVRITGRADGHDYYVYDYCKKFWLSNIESANAKDEKLGRIINMTPTGFISPICFCYADEIKEKKDKKVNNIYTQVVVDNTSVYLRSGGETREIARLGNLAKNEGFDEMETAINEPKITKAIKASLSYILSHQIWIVPLGFGEEHEVAIK